jgi:TPR repeat protein
LGRRTVSLLLATLLAASALAQSGTDVGEKALSPAAAEERGFDYWLGRGVAQDFAEAARWLERAAAGDRPNAAAVLAGLYQRGQGVARDVDRAHALNAQAAAAGVAVAQAALAYDAALSPQNPAARDPAAALPWLNAAAEQEDGFALFMLGQLHRFGDGVEQDAELGFKLVTRAAELGYPPAGVEAAARLLTGEASAADVQRGVYFVRTAAAAGMGSGAYMLGLLHLTGRHVERDFGSAAQWLTRASELEVPFASLRLAELYEKGRGVEADAARAAELREQVLPKLSIGARNGFAWELAVSPDAELRNGAFAVELAEGVTAERPTPAYLDTLAAAYAEAGRFAEAARAQQQAIDALGDNAPAATLDDFAARLELFRSGQPYREAP